jgi:hypothetical protein
MDIEHDAQVDHVEGVQAEVAQIVVHGLGQLLRRERRTPRGIVAAQRADLGDDDEIVAIGVQRFADDLIGDVRAVEVAGVDVVHAGGHHGLAQDGQRDVTVFRLTEHARARELHGAIAEPRHAAVAEGEGAGFFDGRHGRSPLKVRER